MATVEKWRLTAVYCPPLKLSFDLEPKEPETGCVRIVTIVGYDAQVAALQLGARFNLKVNSGPWSKGLDVSFIDFEPDTSEHVLGTVLVSPFLGPGPRIAIKNPVI